MDLEWIIQGLRKPGKTQVGLAGALGIDKSGVSRLMAGGRQLKAVEVAKIADYLEVSSPLEEERELVTLFRLLPQAVRDGILTVVRAATRGPGGTQGGPPASNRKGTNRRELSTGKA